MHSFTIKTRNALYTSRYLFIKYHHLEQGGRDHSGEEHSPQAPPGWRCCCTTPASLQEGQPSAELARCPSASGSDARTVSRRTSRCLSTLQKRPQHLRGVHHPLTGSSGVFRASSVAGFPPYLALVRKLSIFQTCMVRAAEGGG